MISRCTPTITLFLAFAAIYFIWGSSYLAIRTALATIPPFLLAALRFTAAAILLYGWRRLRGDPNPSKREWAAAALLGVILFLASYGALFWAEQHVASGIAAVLFATMQLWVVLLEGLLFRNAKITAKSIAGIVAGLCGVGVLTWNPHLLPSMTDRFSAALVVISSILWAAGSVLTPRLSLPRSEPMSAAAQMLTGGLLLFIPAALSREFRRISWSHISGRSLLSLIYLIVFASLIAFTAYVWLLSREPVSKISTYAYVNPIVAVIIGHLLASEPITRQTLFGAALIVTAVLMAVSGRYAELHSGSRRTVPTIVNASPHVRD